MEKRKYIGKRENASLFVIRGSNTRHTKEEQQQQQNDSLINWKINALSWIYAKFINLIFSQRRIHTQG